MSRHCDEHMWVFLWKAAAYVCYMFGQKPNMFATKREHSGDLIEMSSTNCKAAVRSCPEQALMPIDHCYYPFLCEWFWNVAAYVCYMFGQKPHTKQFIAYHYSSLVGFITHHYSSLRNSLLIITHHYSNSITHHYSPLHYLRWVKKSLRSLKIWCHKTMHTRPLRMKIEGGAGPPLDFCA